MLVWTKSPLISPAAVVKLLAARAAETSDRGHAARGHPVRIEPHPHREGLATENLGIGDPIDRLQSRLNHAVQVIGDLRGGENLRIEGHIKDGGRIAGLLDDDRIESLARQKIFDLIYLRQDIGDRAVRIGVEEKVEGNRRGILLRIRNQRVNAFGTRHRLHRGAS